MLSDYLLETSYEIKRFIVQLKCQPSWLYPSIDLKNQHFHRVHIIYKKNTNYLTKFVTFNKLPYYELYYE